MEKKMTNKEFLKCVSRLQKVFQKDAGHILKLLYKDGFIGIWDEHIRVEPKKFHELEKEGLFAHVSKICPPLEGIDEPEGIGEYEAMTPDGDKIIAYRCG